MKIRLVLVCGVLMMTAFFARDVFSSAESKPQTPATPSKIGVVGILQIIQERARGDKQLSDILAERNKGLTELAELSKEIEVNEADLRHLKSDSSDYIKELEQLVEKKTRLQSRKEFLDRQAVLRQQLWTQQLYIQVVQASRQVAAEKGLDLVLTKDEPENLPVSEQFSNAVATQKVLYSGGCVDITEDVRSRLKIEKPQ